MMLDTPNNQHQTHQQGALEVLTSRAYKCQGFATPPSTIRQNYIQK